MSSIGTPLPERLRAAGVFLFKGFLTSDSYLKERGVPTLEEILSDARAVQLAAPLFTPRMEKDGVPFRYQMTNCGDCGWLASPAPEDCVIELTDDDLVTPVRNGYCYSRVNPFTGKRWPAMPNSIKKASIIAAQLANCRAFKPEVCLLNYYATTRQTLGIHRDNTELNLQAPIISISIGDTGIFQIGGATKGVRPDTVALENGDCLVMSGASRNFYHTFTRLLPGTSNALSHGGRLNLTIRQVR